MLDNIKIEKYSENGKIVLLNKDNWNWVRMSEETYNEKMKNEPEFYQELGGKFRFFKEEKRDPINIKSVYFSLTGRCNLQCEFCAANSGPHTSTENNLSLLEIKENLIPKLKRLSGIKQLTLTGGEPMMRKDIIEITRLFADAIGKDKIIFQTNGLLLTDDSIKQLSDYIDTFEISIENIFESKTLLENMEKIFSVILENGSFLNFSFVVNKKSRTYLQRGLDLAHKYKAGFIMRIVSAMGRGINNIDHFANDEFFDIYVDALEHISEKGYYEENIIDNFISNPRAAQFCGAYGKVMAIQADGSIYICSNLRKDEFSLGNIKDMDCNEITEKYQEVINRESIKKLFMVDLIEQCRGCKIKYFCTGPCVAEAINGNVKEKCNLNRAFKLFMLFYYDRKLSIDENIKNYIHYLKEQKA